LAELITNMKLTISVIAVCAFILVGCGSSPEPQLTEEQARRSQAAGAEAQSQWSPEMVEKFKEAKAPDVSLSDKNAAPATGGTAVAADESK